MNGKQTDLKSDCCLLSVRQVFEDVADGVEKEFIVHAVRTLFGELLDKVVQDEVGSCKKLRENKIRFVRGQRRFNYFRVYNFSKFLRQMKYDCSKFIINKIHEVIPKCWKWH